MWMKKWLLPIVIVLIIAAEILRIYFLMPFPGSQQDNTVLLAHTISKYIWWLRIAAYAFIISQLIRLAKNRKWLRLGITLFFVALYALLTYYLIFKLNADKMFRQPTEVIMLPAEQNQVAKSKLVIGVVINNEAKAYPIEIIGYHHQVRDVVGGREVMITYCTVCRTGRVFDPIVNGVRTEFRLVGMDHFNAMFEDNITKSWWRQATGEAVAGKLKGSTLDEIPSAQMPLQRWLEKYPNSTILQPDEHFRKDYNALNGYDEGNINSDLEKRSNLPWQDKSWVVSVETSGLTKAFDWITLQKEGSINDTIGDKHIVVVMETDNQTFHAFQKPHSGEIMLAENRTYLFDTAGNKWDMDGKCLEGCSSLGDLKQIPAYQEFYHAYQQFRKK